MDFAVDLWNSILTPGTTPALVKATHFSFVALITVLVGMLYATRSLHFVALLGIAGGLWAAITWFINEVELMKQREREHQAKEGAKEEPLDGAAPVARSTAAEL